MIVTITNGNNPEDNCLTIVMSFVFQHPVDPEAKTSLPEEPLLSTRTVSF